MTQPIDICKGKQFEHVSIKIDKAPESSQRDLTGKHQSESDTDLVKQAHILTRSQSVSSSSDMGRGLDASPSKLRSENEPNLAAHSLTDVSICSQPGCRNRHRNHRHSTPGAFGSYLRLCSVVDLPILGEWSFFSVSRRVCACFVTQVPCLNMILYTFTYFVLFYRTLDTLWPLSFYWWQTVANYECVECDNEIQTQKTKQVLPTASLVQRL